MTTKTTDAVDHRDGCPHPERIEVDHFTHPRPVTRIRCISCGGTNLGPAPVVTGGLAHYPAGDDAA